jgi:hypothetical protein
MPTRPKSRYTGATLPYRGPIPSGKMGGVEKECAPRKDVFEDIVRELGISREDGRR